MENRVVLIFVILFLWQVNADVNNAIPIFNTLDFMFKFSGADDEICQNDMSVFSENFVNNTLWAYKLWDSSAKLPENILNGNRYQFGNFDECISIQKPFQTQYCLATIKIDIKLNNTDFDPLSVEYRPFTSIYDNLKNTNLPHKIARHEIFWGLCIPASCQSEDVKKELESYLNENENNVYIRYSVQMNDNDCQIYKTELSFNFADYFFCFLLIFFVVVVLIATRYHIKSFKETDKPTKFSKMMLCLSAKESVKDLTELEGSDPRFHIFYGLRFWLMMFLIIGHSLPARLTSSTFNLGYIEKLYNYWLFMTWCRGDATVELFFLIGGILNINSFLNRGANYVFNFKSIILRYFRFMPAFAIMTFFYATILDKVGSGPLWPKLVTIEQEYCQSNWWTNMLLVNNIINIDRLCLLQSWYLAADFQMYLFSIPLNMLIRRNNILSWTIFLGVLCLFTALPIAITYLNDIDPFFYYYYEFFSTMRENYYFRTIYAHSYTRIVPFLLGMLLGFIYFQLRQTKFRVSQKTSILTIIFAVCLGCSCIYSGVYFYNPYIPRNPLNNALYATLHRIGFATAGGIIFFILSFGDIPNNFFTWSPMVPLSKLCFGVYLSHMAVQIVNVGILRVPNYISNYIWLRQTISEICISFIIAYFLFIFIENPCNKIIKELLSKKQKEEENCDSKEKCNNKS